MIRILGWMVCLAFMLQACKRESFLKDDPRYFQERLKADMSYQDMVQQFGAPPVDLNDSLAEGKGLHMYQYPLFDSTFVRIGFTTKIEYACLVDERNNLLEDLLQVRRN